MHLLHASTQQLGLDLTKRCSHGHELEEWLQWPLHSSDFKRLADPKTQAVGCSRVAEGIRTVSLCKNHTKSSLSLTLCGEGDSKALNLALCWSVMSTYATASSFPLAILFSLETSSSLLHTQYHFFRTGCSNAFPLVWACSIETRGMELNFLMLSKRLRQSFLLLNAVTGEYSCIARNDNALIF